MQVRSPCAAKGKLALHALRLLLLSGFMLSPGRIPAQFVENIVSDHVRIRVPVEREWIGRDIIPDLERCWQFIDRAIAGKLPRRVLVVGDWSRPASWTHLQEATVFIGVDEPAAASSLRDFLLHCAAREMARMALLELSGGEAGRGGSRALLDGMCEIYAYEFRGSARGLGSAWTLTHLMDRAAELGLARLVSSEREPGASAGICATAPGMTFLLACRQMYGRESLIKLFDAMRKEATLAALSRAFRSTPAQLESGWLQRVREYDSTPDVTVTIDADAPLLKQMTLTPAAARPGSTVRVRLEVEDASSNLQACGIFVEDSTANRVVQVREGSGAEQGSFVADLPVEAGAAPGKRAVRVTAVDLAGNVRNWSGEYSVEP